MSATPLRFLIVDDHKPTRDMIKIILGDLASETIEAADGEESLSLYRLHQPDFVLMDLHMPKMNGITATRLLKAEFPKSRIVIVTQQDESPARRAASAAGACAYLLKENLHQLRASFEKNCFDL